MAKAEKLFEFTLTKANIFELFGQNWENVQILTKKRVNLKNWENIQEKVRNIAPAVFDQFLTSSSIPHPHRFRTPPIYYT